MKLKSKVSKSNTKHIITHSQLEKIEANTAELQECIQSVTQRIKEVKKNPNNIYDITEKVKKTNVN